MADKKVDDSLFEDVPYQAPKAPDDHLFEDVPHPDAVEKPQQVGAGRSALVGAGQGATFGFGDELTAPVVAAGAMTHDALSNDKVAPTVPGESTWDKYSRLMQTYRDVARQEQAAAQEQHPGAYTGGAIAGGLLTMKAPGAALPGQMLGKAGAALPGAGASAEMAPGLTKFFGNVAKGGIEGTGYGAAAGLGEGQGDLSDRAQSAVDIAKTGGTIGMALPIAGQALSSTGKLASKIADIPGVSNTIKNFKQGLAGNDLVTASGRRDASTTVNKMGGDLYGDIKDLTGKVGGQIQSKIDAASEAGEKVDLSDEVPAVLEKLKNIKENGSKEAASYASGVESEIKKILGMKAPEAAEDLSGIAPEGLDMDMVNPKEAEAGEQILVDPKKAQDLKQVLQDYSPRKGMAPQELEPARAAKDLKGSTADKLNDVTGVADAGENGEASLNQQYGGLKDALKMLKVNEKRLPEQIQQDITNTLANLDKENLTGDKARGMVDSVLDKIEAVDPEVAAKYREPLNDAVEKLQLASNNEIKYRGPIGTVVHAIKPGANVAGQILNKVGANKAIDAVSPAVNATKNFANTILNEQAGRSSSAISESNAPVQRAAQAPYQLQRQVASASEKSDPETLKSQAGQIRSQYGQSGERLATQLENMAEKNRDARRALMFTILQDPNNRKMLGLANEENQQ